MQNAETKIKRIVIVGGGTAGWLAANHLAADASEDVSITLVESPDIPTIGVGEGTVPVIVDSLKKFGIRESDMFRLCDATFKNGIHFVGWNKPVNGQPHCYFHPFDDPNVNGVNLLPYWLHQLPEARARFDQSVSIQAHIALENKAPKLITNAEYERMINYAFHLDAGKFSALLSEHAIKNRQVNHVLDEVESVKLALDGSISGLQLKQGGLLEGDLFIDCSGFQSLLLGQALNTPFIDKSDVLFANHAVVTQVPYENEHEVPPYTISTAQQAGWIWDIGLQTRKGVGHVYSDQFTSHEQAHRDLSAYLGKPEDTVESRLIKMQVGYRAQAWVKNCIGIGLSQGFVEPLEATGLLVFDLAARMLSKRLPGERQEIPAIAQQFNQHMTHVWQSIVDFIKLHYCISNRDDSEFWRMNRLPETIPESLQHKLALWRSDIPNEYDFVSSLDVFRLENHLYVLYGMNYPSQCNYPSPQKLSQQEAMLKLVAQQQQKAGAMLETHSDLVAKAARYGFQRI
ncbi:MULTISPECIES: tryptophan halogenase family protein [Pseudoalteromonas]|uniref:tryptophan halogenase family protein n=1 Tax=Pseudoalteromonas TaxID=53246 RepID=UPI000F779DC2|nr:tryptophan halogenase family protein [Pseudoalteromonas rubra]MCG7562480.1 tryptophan 7-halogenase [Pseudoalteromonas sp. McH1-42]